MKETINSLENELQIERDKYLKERESLSLTNENLTKELNENKIHFQQIQQQLNDSLQRQKELQGN